MRVKAREAAMKILFGTEAEKNGADYDFTVESVLKEYELTAKDNDYIESLLAGVRANLPAIDEQIAAFSRGWRIDRLTGIDRSILRIAVYEMFFDNAPLKPSIAINEAVELAKVYGTDDSARFVNGVLGAMSRKTKND